MTVSVPRVSADADFGLLLSAAGKQFCAQSASCLLLRQRVVAVV